jgi:hypothetical protein
MIVDRSILARTPDKTNNRKPFERVAIQQILPIVPWIRLAKLGGKPVIGRDELA